MIVQKSLKINGAFDFNSDGAVQRIFDKAFAKGKPTADLWLAYYKFLIRQGKLEQAEAALSEYKMIKPLGPIASGQTFDQSCLSELNKLHT